MNDDLNLGNHSDNFKDEKDHDNISEVLQELKDSGASQTTIQNFLRGARVDLTDAELLEHLRDYRGKPTVQGNNLDEKWANFSSKHGFSNE